MDGKQAPKTNTAPDGGWGWFVVLAYAMNNMVVIPTMQIFPLLYATYMEEQLKMSVFEISVITALNIICGMLLAIFNGPILRNFGFRKVAITGSFLVFIGNLQTSQATSFWEYIVYFSVFVSIGTNLVMASFNLALNTYFVIRRGVATGIAMTLTGLGPILMPLLTVFLMSSYDVHGAGLIIAAISTHSIAAALLLQPVKWHRRKPKARQADMDDTLEMNNVSNTNAGSMNVTDIKVETAEKHETETNATAATHLIENQNTTSTKRSIPTELNDDENPPLKSLDDVVKPHEDSIRERIVKFFDLDLLNDPMYINISFGLSLAFVTEMSFTLMLPIILRKDHKFDGDITGYMISLLAVSDIVSRFISPFIGESIKSRVRVVYLFSLVCGVFFRTCLINFKGLSAVYFIIIMLGLTKGIRSVYTTLVLPSYVPLSKLPSATGLQMVTNGVMLGICAPVLGKIKDISGNFDLWIHLINVSAMITVLLWFTEMYLVRRQKMNKKPPIVKPGEN